MLKNLNKPNEADKPLIWKCSWRLRRSLNRENTLSKGNTNNMKGRIAVLIALSMVLLFVQTNAWSCTAFNLEGKGYNLFGKNYEWPCENGMVFINKRGLSKVAMRASNNKNDLQGHPIRWTSRYGSITFNQYGRELPTGGMNEAGLVVENMSLPSTSYPRPDSRPFIHRSQWIQYQLDNHKTVAQVIGSDTELRIFPTHKRGMGYHYLVSDTSGDCAVIEFIDGKMVVYSDSRLPLKALANDTYEESLKVWKENRSISYYNRFNRTIQHMGEFKYQTQDSSVKSVFHILSLVSQGDYTKWSIVYDIKNSKIFYRTRSNPGIRYLDLNKLDFSCRTPVRILNINDVNKGDVTERFNLYSFDRNKNLIMESFMRSYKEAFHDFGFQQLLEKIAKYPDTIRCQ